MKIETIYKANEIEAKIKELERQIKEFPRYIIDRQQYEKSGHMYVKRIFERYKFKIRIPKGYYQKDLELELSEEDLQALVDLRKKKIEELKKRLEEL